MRNNLCGIHVIVHCIVALVAQILHLDSCFARCHKTAKCLICLKQTLHTLFGSLQCLVAEIHSAAIMSLKYEETDCHWRIGLRQQLMRTVEELIESNEVTQRLAHLCSVDGYHVVVHPVLYHMVSHCSHTLCNLTFVVREHKVHTATMYIELLAKVFAAHCSTLTVPAGETIAPWRWPAHDMLRLRTLPQCKIGWIAFLVLTIKFACRVQHIIKVTARQNTILVCLVILGNIKID